MSKNVQYAAKVLLVLSSGFLANESLACASCGCTLTSDWEDTHFSHRSGFKIDLRYDYLNQNQLRSGTQTISPATASQRTHEGETLEVESYTRNQYVTLGADYSFNSNWGLNIQLPYIQRDHSTLGTASDGFIPGDDGGQYHSSTNNIGDIKLVGRYQGFNLEHNWGILFGVKLPTGSHSETGLSTDATAPGEVAIDRGLQPGTGSTDAIMGVYVAQAWNKHWDYFAQVLLQAPLATQDDFQPGEGINANIGLRYSALDYLSPQLQLNARRVARDSGDNADTISTGGTLVYLSPGVSFPLNPQTAVNAYIQLPIYQNINGVQLVPSYTASLSLKYRF